MNTEITKYNGEVLPLGWIFFDAECGVCAAGRRRLGRIFERRGFRWLPLQTPGTAARLGVSEAELRAEMRLQLADGRVLSGIDVWAYLWRSVWWMSPLAMIIELPGVKALAERCYRWFARHRYCLGGACRLPAKPDPNFRWVELVLLPVGVTALVLWATWEWPAWQMMWLTGIALGFVGKWLTWRDTRNGGRETPLGRSILWFCCWPGLDAHAFFACDRTVPKPVSAEWWWALGKLALGIAMLGSAVLADWHTAHLVRGWTGMIGVVLCLHFGIFHVLSLVLRTVGIDAAPIMNRPLAATSLGNFWGARWNTAFSIPARRLILKPLGRRWGVPAASLAVFAVSGVLHELVISVPARAGFGLPTAYFLLHGFAVWLETTALGKLLGMGRGLSGWSWTLILTVGPVGWLFHPNFVCHVTLPMLDALGTVGDYL